MRQGFLLGMHDIAMVAADTSRSRAYLQALARNNLVPNYVLILDDTSDETMPGQLDNPYLDTKAAHFEDVNECWSEVCFDLTQPIKILLDQHAIPYEVSGSRDINDPSVVRLISRRHERVFIYSGFGGAILGKNILTIGKDFLHVHGGYLPDFKGSTSNYFSLIAESCLGASAIFLTDKIDGGPILHRRKFPPPQNRQLIEHRYDSAARAKVLVESIQKYLKNGEWEFELPSNSDGETYYIIHPVLKHLAILGQDRESWGS